jgi:cytochrome P450
MPAGHVSTLLSDRCPLQLADWANSYGPVYKLQLLNRACVILTDPAAAHDLIRWGSSDNYLGKTRELYRALELGTEPKMPNILTSPDDAYWKAVRQATAPCFSISNLKQVGRQSSTVEGILAAATGYRSRVCVSSAACLKGGQVSASTCS